jgi:hypothetical protein
VLIIHSGVSTDPTKPATPLSDFITSAPSLREGEGGKCDFEIDPKALEEVAFDVSVRETLLSDFTEERPAPHYVKPSYKQFTLQGVELSYKEWVAANTYIVLRKKVFDVYNPLRVLDESYIGVKACKRGNDVYARRLQERFKTLEEGCLLDTPVTVGEGRELKTRALFVTLTCDANRGVSVIEAWKDLGKEFNKFMANVRFKYGRVSILRGWEAFNNGYPHIHALLLFHDVLFHTFEHVNKKGRRVLRVQSKHAFDPFWHSFVDIEAMRTARDGYFYVQKYIKKTYGNDVYADSDMALRTKALLWYFNKRSFAVSGEFLDGLSKLNHRLDSSMHNSKWLLDVGTYSDVSYQFMGVVDMPLSVRKWFLILGDEAG